MMNNSTFSNVSGNVTECFPKPYSDEKIVMVLMIGTVLALLGIFVNSLLVYTFTRKSLMYTPGTLYLGTLAFFDIILNFLYIIIFPVKVLYDEYESRFWSDFWFSYVTEAFAVSKIVQTASAYLIIAATTERLLAVYNFRYLSMSSCTKQKRMMVTCAVMSWALCLKGVSFFELRLAYGEDCQMWDFDEFHGPMSIEWYRKLSFYYTNIFCVIIPFMVLIVLNLLITYRLNRPMHESISNHNFYQARAPVQTTSFSNGYIPVSNGNQSSNAMGISSDPAAVGNYIITHTSPKPNESPIAPLMRRSHCLPPVDNPDNDSPSHCLSNTEGQIAKHKRQTARTATIMLIMVVCTYLVSQSLSFFIGITEFWDKKYLLKHSKFYNLSADVVSLLAIFASTFRFVIYYACNVNVRKEIDGLFGKQEASRLNRKAAEMHGNRSVQMDEDQERTACGIEVPNPEQLI